MAKTDFDNSVSSLNSKIAVNKTKNESIKNELKKLKAFDSGCFRGKSHFEEDGTQNYLVFHLIGRYFKVIASTDYVSSWKSKGLSAETIKPLSMSDNSLTPSIKLLWWQNKSKFYRKLFKTTKYFIHSWKNCKHLHCL